jgi:hypothetical protein
MVDLLWQSTDKRSLETVMFRHIEMAVCCAKPPYALRSPDQATIDQGGAQPLPKDLRIDNAQEE